MTGRFNQDLPENLQMAFEKAMNFKPRIITKQSINNRKIHEVNHIDVGHEDEIEINEAHVRNPNYKGKNYDPNFAQNRLKATKKVEVNEATVKEAIKYGQFLKKSKEDITEAIDIYKTVGNKTFYGPEEDPADQQEQPQQ